MFPRWCCSFHFTLGEYCMNFGQRRQISTTSMKTTPNLTLQVDERFFHLTGFCDFSEVHYEKGKNPTSRAIWSTMVPPYCDLMQDICYVAICVLWLCNNLTPDFYQEVLFANGIRTRWYHSINETELRAWGISTNCKILPVIFSGYSRVFCILCSWFYTVLIIHNVYVW